MEGSLADSILHVCKVLNKHSVEYLLIGGTAVALHGYYRLSRQTSGDWSTIRLQLIFCPNCLAFQGFATLTVIVRFRKLAK